MNATRFWNGIFADFARLSTGVISLTSNCFGTILCAFQIIFLIFYASITVLFFDNSLLTIPGRPQLATELLQSFLYEIQNHFVYLFFKSISLTYQ
jgi:protein-S-isoprenylcysteine O-methyltransferase Ste14